MALILSRLFLLTWKLQQSTLLTRFSMARTREATDITLLVDTHLATNLSHVTVGGSHKS